MQVLIYIKDYLSDCFKVYNYRRAQEWGSIMRLFIGLLLIILLCPCSYAKEEHAVLNANIHKSYITPDTVVYNTKTGKVHRADCIWALLCTKNCIYITKDEILERYYIPCFNCGGIKFIEKDK